MNAVVDFYTDWTVKNAFSTDPAAYWPQAREIVWHCRKEALSDVAFSTNVFSWLYRNPKTPWEPETEELFAHRLRQSYDKKSVEGVAPLLRAWTRAGTYLPARAHRDIIDRFLDICDVATGTRILSFAPGVAQLLSQEKRESWLAVSEAYVRARPHTVDIPQVVFAYLHGGTASLTPEQRRGANDMLLGRAETYPIPFAWARSLATSHPQPEELQAAYLRMALNFAIHPDKLAKSRTIALNDCQQTLYPWLRQAPPRDPLLQTECLLIGALLAREAPEWSASSVWQEALPANWVRVQAALPILESLHGPAWSRTNAEKAVFALVTMLGPAPPEGLSTMALPLDLLTPN